MKWALLGGGGGGVCFTKSLNVGFLNMYPVCQKGPRLKRTSVETLEQKYISGNFCLLHSMFGSAGACELSVLNQRNKVSSLML